MKFKSFSYILAMILMFSSGPSCVSAMESPYDGVEDVDDYVYLEEASDLMAFEIEYEEAQFDQDPAEEIVFSDQENFDPPVEPKTEFMEESFLPAEDLIDEEPDEVISEEKAEELFSDYQADQEESKEPFEYIVKDDSIIISNYNADSQEVTIPEEIDGFPVRIIGENAFRDNTSLQKIILPAGLNRIERYAFYGCTRLSELNLPDELEYIGVYAFSGCKELTELVLPAAIRGVNISVFDECSKLVLYRTLQNNSLEVYSYQNETGTFFSIPQYVNNKKVAAIGEYAFSEAVSLEQISIPSSVTSIGTGAFCRCLKLKRISVPDSVTKLGAGAFYGCISLVNVNLSKNLKKLRNSTFSDCISLDYIRIPNTITNIGDTAFYHCTGLNKIRISPKTTNISLTAFQKCSPTLKIAGYRGSYADSYARNNNIKFVNLGLSYPLIRTIKNVSSGVKLTWSPVKKAASYKIYRKDKSSGKLKLIKTIKNKNTKTISWIDKNVVSGKKYTYTIRSYRNGVKSPKHPEMVFKYLKTTKQ